MEVILIKDIENLGYANDIVNVKPGYANNYLIPPGLREGSYRSCEEDPRREPQAACPQGCQDPGRRTGSGREDRQPAAGNRCQGRGGTHLRCDHRCRPRRGFGCQRNRNRPQDHCRGEHQDPRRIRGRRQDSPRRQSDNQIYGNRRGVIPSLRFNRKGRSYRSAFFVGSPERKTAPACPPPSRNPEISIGKNKKIATFANGCGPGRRRRPCQTDARRIRSRRNSRFGAMHGREHSVPTPQKDPARLASHMRYCPDRNPNVRTPHA